MRGTAAGRPPKTEPSKHLFADMMKALEGGDDSRVGTALLQMEVDEVEYLLVLTKRLEELLSGHLRKKLRGLTKRQQDEGRC